MQEWSGFGLICVSAGGVAIRSMQTAHGIYQARVEELHISTEAGQAAPTYWYRVLKVKDKHNSLIYKTSRWGLDVCVRVCESACAEVIVLRRWSKSSSLNKSATQFFSFIMVGCWTLTLSISGHFSFVRPNSDWQRHSQHVQTIPVHVKPSLDWVYVPVIVFFKRITVDHLKVAFWIFNPWSNWNIITDATLKYTYIDLFSQINDILIHKSTIKAINSLEGLTFFSDFVYWFRFIVKPENMVRASKVKFCLFLSALLCVSSSCFIWATVCYIWPYITISPWRGPLHSNQWPAAWSRRTAY